MRISVPNPCHEDWNKMDPATQGAFCKACAKVVVDFSQMTDAEVIAYLQNSGNQKTCGRFKATQLAPYQLNVNLRNIARHPTGKVVAVTLFLVFTSLFVCKSDTGQLQPVQVSLTNVLDTTQTVLLQIDSTAALHTTGEPALPETIIMGDTYETEPVKADTSLPPTAVMGFVAIDNYLPQKTTDSLPIRCNTPAERPIQQTNQQHTEWPDSEFLMGKIKVE